MHENFDKAIDDWLTREYEGIYECNVKPKQEDDFDIIEYIKERDESNAENANR